MLGNIGNLFVKHMQQVTKGYLYHLLGYRITMQCIGRRPNQFCETSAKGTNWVTDPFRWFYELVCLEGPLVCESVGIADVY